MKPRLALILAGVLAQGCAETMIAPPSPRRLAIVEPGMTRSTVLNLLGLPNDARKDRSPAGELVWTWTYAEGVKATSVPLVRRPLATSTPGATGLTITWTPDWIVADARPFGEPK